MNDMNLIKPRGLQRQVQCFRDVPDFHRRAELPGDEVTREVVQYRGEVKPGPADDLEIGEVGLPKLVRRRRLVLELIGGLHDDVGGTGDQVVVFQQAIDRSLRDKIAFRVSISSVGADGMVIPSQNDVLSKNCLLVVRRQAKFRLDMTIAHDWRYSNSPNGWRRLVAKEIPWRR